MQIGGGLGRVLLRINRGGLGGALLRIKYMCRSEEDQVGSYLG